MDTIRFVRSGEVERRVTAWNGLLFSKEVYTLLSSRLFQSNLETRRLDDVDDIISTQQLP
jgi:hypothetical protein